MQPTTYIFFGPSGSGKGTQARLLIDELKKRDQERKVLYLETGDKLREFAEEASLTSHLTKEVLEKGELLPEFLPIWIWTEYMVRHISGGEHLFIDGSPRKLEEAHILDSAIKFYKREKPIIISIEVSSDWARKRLTERGRSDDNDQEILKRLRWYDDNVVPAIDYFKNDSYYRFVHINGERSIEEVHQDIISKVGL
jgi:adenylate kinase family enzyme